MKNQTILITGASKGIGRALTTQLACDNTIIAVGRDAAALEAIAGTRTDAIHPVVADLNNLEQRQALLDNIKNHWPELTVIINNAAIQQPLNCLDGIEAADIDRELTINLYAPLHISCELLPLLLGKSQAWLMNITSVLAVCPKQSTPIYNASKTGLRIFTQAIRFQLRNSTVQVVEVVPPITATGLNNEENNTAAVSSEWVAKRIIEQWDKGQNNIEIGQARLGLWLHRWFPGLLHKMLIKK